MLRTATAMAALTMADLMPKYKRVQDTWEYHPRVSGKQARVWLDDLEASTPRTVDEFDITHDARYNWRDWIGSRSFNDTYKIVGNGLQRVAFKRFNDIISSNTKAPRCDFVFYRADSNSYTRLHPQKKKHPITLLYEAIPVEGRVNDAAWEMLWRARQAGRCRAALAWTWIQAAGVRGAWRCRAQSRSPARVVAASRTLPRRARVDLDSSCGCARRVAMPRAVS